VRNSRLPSTLRSPQQCRISGFVCFCAFQKTHSSDSSHLGEGEG